MGVLRAEILRCAVDDRTSLHLRCGDGVCRWVCRDSCLRLSAVGWAFVLSDSLRSGMSSACMRKRAIKVDSQTYLSGRFARLHDPEGNPIELWRPKLPGAAG